MSTATVTVACKIPNGLIIHIEKREKTVEPSPAGGRTIEVGRRIGEPIVLNGPTNALTGQPPAHQIVSGYGLTHGVPKDFWDKWIKDNAGLDVVVNGLVFAHEKREDAEAQARDQKSLRTNLEPLDPDGRNADKSLKDPRMVKGIKKAEEKEEA